MGVARGVALENVPGLAQKLRKVSGTLKEYGWGDVMVDPPIEAADALTALSLQLAAVEGEHYVVVSTDDTDQDGFNIERRVAWKDILLDRTETAEASLTLAQEENERLRKIISDSAEALGNGAFIAPTCSIDFMSGLPNEIKLHVATLSTPSKEDKTDAE